MSRKLYSLVPQSVLAWLCHYANANPSGCRNTFYALKDRLLNQYAEFLGYEMQEITKPCWGDKRDDYGDWHGCGPTCRRCGGTGIFDRKWIRLQRWEWGKYVFHIPDGSTRIQPDSVQIHGRIKHANHVLASREAELWLYVVTLQFGMWWHVLSTSHYVYPKLWPMCRLQKYAMAARMTFTRRRCFCGKRFFKWGTGWLVCKQCRRSRHETNYHAIPF